MNNREKNQPWSITIFSSREDWNTLDAAISSACIAAEGLATIDIIINGNEKLANHATAELKSKQRENYGATIRVWSIKLGDKANAWNQFFHQIWKGQELNFFMDGYVSIERESLKNLAAGIENHQNTLGGTGVPTSGRSAQIMAEAMLAIGGIHGNLCCIKGSVIEKIRHIDFYIPVGMYRTDSLIGSLLSLNLDPISNKWNSKLIHVEPTATWKVKKKEWWSLGDILAKMKQIQRQQRGLLENQAVIHHLFSQKKRFEELPESSTELLLSWQRDNPKQAKRFMWWNPLTKLIWKEAVQPKSFPANDKYPQCLIELRSDAQAMIEGAA
jgi:hypothetical protein